MRCNFDGGWLQSKTCQLGTHLLLNNTGWTTCQNVGCLIILHGGSFPETLLNFLKLRIAGLCSSNELRNPRSAALAPWMPLVRHASGLDMCSIPCGRPTATNWPSSCRRRSRPGRDVPSRAKARTSTCQRPLHRLAKLTHFVQLTQGICEMICTSATG